MTMISSAQNFEDVMLARAFCGRKDGFYIDIGAWHPTVDSVTRYFYDLGWRGINVEPSPAYHGLLVADRPLDINLDCAAGDREGEIELMVFAECGGSSLNPDYRRHFEAKGLAATPVRRRMTTLAQICREHAPAAIDFLKIDVEGWERQVIAGADWRRTRPRVVLVEATLPNSTIPAWADWEPLLLEARYRFVYFDGINRFYVADEAMGELGAHFQAPPNLHDDFVLRRTWVAEQALGWRAQNPATAAGAPHPRIEALEAELRQARRRIDEMTYSRSWRITQPLRWLSRRLSE